MTSRVKGKKKKGFIKEPKKERKKERILKVKNPKKFEEFFILLLFINMESL